MADKEELRGISLSPTSLEDIDQAAYDWLDEQMSLQTSTAKGFRKVPVQWVAGEKSFQAKNNPSLRDSSGALILPMITIERTSVVKDPSKKGTAFANLPKNSDKQAGAITVARRINQDKTSNFANAEAMRTRGKINFRTRRKEKVVYETVTMAMPVYIEASYKISIKTEYQQQMNDLVQPFITFPGSRNHVVIENKKHRFEGFIQSDFSMDNSVSDMQGERVYQTEVELKVLAPLIGDGVNSATPRYTKRESAVEFKVSRERTVLNPDYEPPRMS